MSEAAPVVQPRMARCIYCSGSGRYEGKTCTACDGRGARLDRTW